LSNKC